MVRSTFMWAIDQSLRPTLAGRARLSRRAPWRCSCDLHQLAGPSSTTRRWPRHLESQYGGPFVLRLAALVRRGGHMLLELEQVFPAEGLPHCFECAQQDPRGEVDERILSLLNGRVHPIRTLSDGEPYVILTPTQRAAGGQHGLSQCGCPGQPRTYQAATTGEFNQSAQPTDARWC